MSVSQGRCDCREGHALYLQCKERLRQPGAGNHNIPLRSVKSFHVVYGGEVRWWKKMAQR